MRDIAASVEVRALIGAASFGGILSVFAARAGAARVFSVERTSAVVLAQELAATNGYAEIVQVIHGDVMDLEAPERVDVIVSEWLGGFGIDEGMLVPVIVARDRWLKPGGVMIPHMVTAWAALVHDRYLAEMVEFLRDNTGDAGSFMLRCLLGGRVHQWLLSDVEQSGPRGSAADHSSGGYRPVPITRAGAPTGRSCRSRRAIVRRGRPEAARSRAAPRRVSSPRRRASSCRFIPMGRCRRRWGNGSWWQ
jgi:hypothetical protein